MNGELHLLFRIAALGNGYLLDGYADSAADLDSDAQIRVRFTDGPDEFVWREWLDKLKQTGCQRLMLVSGDSAMAWRTSGYAGGGPPAGIMAIGVPETALWTVRWKLTGQGTPRARWEVRCVRTPDSGGTDVLRRYVPMRTAAEELTGALREASGLAEAIRLPFWSGNFFEPALAIAEGRAKLPKLAFDLPVAYSEEASRLLQAAYKAWVFGGMGSWIDDPPSAALEYGLGREYEACSARLYAALLQAGQAAVNSVVF